MTLKAKLAALAACSIVFTAHAEIRTFTFTGTVTESSPTAPVGAQVTGSFAYDTEAVPYFEYDYPDRPVRNAAFLGVAQSFRMQVNGHTLLSESIEVETLDARRGRNDGEYGDFLRITGNYMTLDGTRFEEGLFSIYLISQPTSLRALTGTQPPRNIHVKRFDWQNYGSAQVNGSSTGTILSFHVDRIKVNKSEPDDDE